jgi:hypothetical protein
MSSENASQILRKGDIFYDIEGNNERLEVYRVIDLGIKMGGSGRTRRRFLIRLRNLDKGKMKIIFLDRFEEY